MVDAAFPTNDLVPLACLRCGLALQPGAGNFFLVTIKAVADPTPPTISDEDLAGDVRQRIERLLAQMQGLSEQEALDQVYRCRSFALCNACFGGWIEDPTGGQGL